MNILISGAGIAGPCLAYWLRHHGFEPTLVERAPRLRTGGYVVDFWGAGFDVAERMGIVPQILRKGYSMREVRQVDRSGRRSSGFKVEVFDRITHGRYTSIPRSDLAASIFETLDDRIEAIFDDSIVGIEERADSVQVRFERTPARAFDLVIGADGLHSQVRKLTFGDQARFERPLGLKVAAFIGTGYRPRDELVYVMHSEVGRQVGRFALRGDRTMFLFVFRDADPSVPDGIAAQRALVREKFSGSGWEECPHILAALDAADDAYLDRVSQIRMEQWAKGRLALVGDAAFCISLLGGQGSALAMVAAYVLAGELKRANGDHETAFARYHDRLGDFVAAKQAAAIQFAPFFAPRSAFGIFFRNQVMKLMSIPFVAEMAVGREMRDRFELPSY
jgi:2-polyprenyl-6-methoxyphenol hydroxylase-like FAD-dependent oxidoreductase